MLCCESLPQNFCGKKKIKDSHSEDRNLRDVRASLNLTSSLTHSAGQLLRNTFSCGLAWTLQRCVGQCISINYKILKHTEWKKNKVCKLFWEFGHYFIFMLLSYLFIFDNVIHIMICQPMTETFWFLNSYVHQ